MNNHTSLTSCIKPRFTISSGGIDPKTTARVHTRSSSGETCSLLQTHPEALSAEEIGLVSGGSFATGIAGAALGTIGGATAGRIAGIAIGSAAGGPVGAIIGLGIGIGWVFATSRGAGSRYRIAPKLR